MTVHSPTRKAYSEFQAAYDFFNAELFGGKLPPCLITMQRHARAFGYFAPERFGAAADGEVTDEIAMNPKFFRERTTRESLSTLAHEMVHLRQQHFGKPSRGGYHNAEWAEMMKAIGLHPSNTGEPGGKEVGQKVSHYIVDGGPFDLACAGFLAAGGAISYADRWDDGDAAKKKTRAKKAASKTRFTCPTCGANAWAKAAARLLCAGPAEGEECMALMLAEEAAE